MGALSKGMHIVAYTLISKMVVQNDALSRVRLQEVSECIRKSIHGFILTSDSLNSGDQTFTKIIANHKHRSVTVIR